LSMQPVIEIKNLYFSYERDWVLRNINLNVEKGEFLAFIGPNGSGKSTLFKLILGFLYPQKGSIKVLGDNVKEFSRWNKVGYISQNVKDFNQSFPATVKEIVGANLYKKMGFLKILNSDLEKEIVRVLKLVNMEKFKDRPIGKLSGGQQQRVFIARSLVNEPEVLLLDEPLVGVDQEAQREFYRTINWLHHELQITIIMISHDINVISAEVNRVVCFSGGEIYIHCAGEFDFKDYLEQVKHENKLLIPRHEHGRE